MFKKLIATAATLVLGAGLAVVGIAAPASATPPAYPPTGSAANNPDNWEVLEGETCFKLEPVTTVPYILGAPPAGREWSKVIVKTGSGPDANTVYESGLVEGAGFQHATKVGISHLVLCSTPLPDDVDCEAATVVTGEALTNGDHINMTITQGGSSFQTNAYIDIRQAQDPQSESGLVARISKTVGQQQIPLAVLPITNAQKASGVFTFEYATYLTGTWTVTWVQFDSHNKHFTGTLVCGSEPPCLTDEAVSYWYSPATNSGWIDVADVEGSTGELCDPFWVTATTWKFLDDDSVWPQKLHQKQDLYIDKTGHYEYGIDVECGQGDIYASFDAQPAPTDYLYGPDNPFDEHFLHQMGFTGPAPTYTQDKPGCNIVTPVAPVATAITECGVYGSVVAEDTAEIDYTITGTGNQGIYTVTAAATETYVLAAGAPASWTFDLGTYVDCVEPKVDFRLGVCTPNGEEPNRFSTKDLFITLDNTASDGPVTFTVVGAKDIAGADPTADIVRTVPAGESLEVETTAVTDAGTEYVVTFSAPGASIPNQTITVPAFEGCLDGQPGDPSHTNEQCVYGEVTGGSITVLPLTGFQYTIDGPNGLHLENVGETTTGLAAGTYEVTVTALPGYVLTGPEKWPYEIVIEEPENCVELPIPVVPTSVIECDADGSYTLPAGDGYDWFIGDAPVADGVHTVATAGSFTVTARVVDSSYGFPGGVQQVEFPLSFVEPENCVTLDAAANLDVKPATCLADGAIDPTTLLIQNATWSAPLPTTPGNHTVTAVATPGHAFPGGATTKVFEIVIPAMLPSTDPLCQLPDLAIVTPTYSMTPLTCTAAGSFTLGAVDPGTVNWSIDGGEPKTGGTFPVTTAKSVSLVATPVDPEDGLDEDWPYTEENPLVLTFTAGTANCDLATLAFTGIGNSIQLGLLGLMVGIVGLGVFFVARRVREQR